MHDELPNFLLWNPEDNSSLNARDENQLFSLHLEYLYSDFLLYRILTKRTRTRSDELINASREIMNALLAMIAQKNRARKPTLDIGWEVGVPIQLRDDGLTFSVVLLLPPCSRRTSHRTPPSMSIPPPIYRRDTIPPFGDHPASQHLRLLPRVSGRAARGQLRAIPAGQKCYPSYSRSSFIRPCPDADG